MRKSIRLISRLSSLVMIAAAWASGAVAEEAASPSPKIVPKNRPEMKQAIEALKKRTARLPAPQLTDEQKARLGERGNSIESQLRAAYMPFDASRGGAGQGNREPDPNLTLSYEFKTMLFWIVSRTNNCHYCMGHQEVKLAVAGLSEEQIAGLDGDWSEFTEAERAAFRYARKLTFEPHRITDDDIDGLRKHYTDMQILEMTFSVAGNNATNRWKDSLGLPQSEDLSDFLTRSDKPAPDRPLPLKSFLTATPDKYKDLSSQVAPLRSDSDEKSLDLISAKRRPKLESRDAVEAALAACRARAPRLPLVDEGQTRKILADEWPSSEPVPQWARLLANFPRDGKSRIASMRTAEEKGDLKPLLKAQVTWIAARQDRAWYAVGHAKARLRELGVSEDDIYKLDGAWDGYTPAERSAFAFARKLTATMELISDADIADLRKHHSDRDIVQLVSYMTHKAFFDRITEASGLALEN